MDTLTPIAHVHPDDRHPVHPLHEHLSAVSQLAGQMAADFGACEWGKLAGLWHDLGKYSPAFQQYIRSATGYEAHLVDCAPGKVNHSSAGALHAQKELGTLCLPLAYVIAGHHAGLADWYGDVTGGAALCSRMERGLGEGLLQQAAEAAPESMKLAIRPVLTPERFGGAKGMHLWIRMLFSCLADADFLDTEAFMDATRSEQRGHYPGLQPCYRFLTGQWD